VTPITLPLKNNPYLHLYSQNCERLRWINAVAFTNQSASGVGTLSVNNGTLTIQTVTSSGNYGFLKKTGDGVLKISGRFNPSYSYNAGVRNAGTIVESGKLLLSGTTTAAAPHIVDALTVESTATLAGQSYVRIHMGNIIHGRIAPGSVTTSSNFGDVATLTFIPTTGYDAPRTSLVDFNFDGILDFDFKSDGTCDRIAFSSYAVANAYANLTFNLSSNAQINFNAMDGLFADDDYRIITIGGPNANVAHFFNYIDGNTTYDLSTFAGLDTLPEGSIDSDGYLTFDLLQYDTDAYDCKFKLVYNGDDPTSKIIAIDLHVSYNTTTVPEPASLGLLSLGAGLLLLRRKR